MSSRSRDAVLTDVLASIVGNSVDVADVLADLVAGCSDDEDAGAVALLARSGGSGGSAGSRIEEGLALLAATSHNASELEMLQAQHLTGPCVDAMTTHRFVLAEGDDLVREYGDVGRAIRDAGFERVEAYPMRWRGETLGGLNVFHHTVGGEEGHRHAQTYADLASVVLAQSGATSAMVGASLDDALVARSVVEQAKGVLAYVEDLDMEQAYRLLLRLSHESERSLTELAETVVRLRRRP
ncbi:MAG: ANTAR domain-containing protein [Actinobacteria bacterium]|nr:ANTAR domain-containing protein [Actinomycetota bacterium]